MTFDLIYVLIDLFIYLFYLFFISGVGIVAGLTKIRLVVMVVVVVVVVVVVQIPVSFQARYWKLSSGGVDSGGGRKEGRKS